MHPSIEERFSRSITTNNGGLDTLRKVKMMYGPTKVKACQHSEFMAWALYHFEHPVTVGVATAGLPLPAFGTARLLFLASSNPSLATREGTLIGLSQVQHP
ncbi:hypothetical protein SRHO_G00080170 [Serrasalmus rhombeus]